MKCLHGTVVTLWMVGHPGVDLSLHVKLLHLDSSCKFRTGSTFMYVRPWIGSVLAGHVKI